MARLVLINGLPSSGKSTLAQRYAGDHPLTLVLDIDVVRALLGGWMQVAESGLVSRRLALAMARVQLVEGRDVVVPQFLGRLTFVLELQALCAEVGAQFVEVVLLPERPEDVISRFERRTAASLSAQHRDAAVELERLGGVGALQEMAEQLREVLTERPHTRTVTSFEGEVDRAYADLLAAIG